MNLISDAVQFLDGSDVIEELNGDVSEGDILGSSEKCVRSENEDYLS